MARPSKETREVGRRVVASVRRSLAERLAEAWRSDPERLASAVELGIINPAWVEAPSEHNFSAVAPIEVVERFLERSTEQRPSMLASLGLTALQVLGSSDNEETPDGGQVSRLAVLFTDLENFTAFTAAEGDEIASRLLVEHHRAAASVVRGRGGKLVKRLGDGLLVTFPAAEAAVLAGLELLSTAPEPLRLRAGAHLGEVVISRHDVLGHVVNVAARVTDRAKGDEMLVTSELVAEASGLQGVEFGRTRQMRLKGLPEHVGVCRASVSVDHGRAGP